MTLCLVVAAVTLLVYWQLPTHEFLNYDDQMFVYQNPHVYTGLTISNLKWAFPTLNGHASYWHPLTWLSLQLDCTLFGVRSGPTLMTNLVLHLLNAALLLILIEELTGHVWRAAFISAMFALHPLHLETVAWVSERKTLTCTFFWLLATLAYVRYARKRSSLGYALVIVAFTGALMSKPFAVTLPFTFLLLDFWPLRQIGWTQPSGGSATEGWAKNWLIIAEKIPMLILSGLASWLTVLAQMDLGAVSSLERVPLSARLWNSIVSYGAYLRKMILPIDLAPIYPLRTDWPWWLVLGNALFLVGFSIFALRSALRRPYVFVGWFWYVGTLVPVIGLVQVGSQGMADRYTYISLTGVFLLATWALCDLTRRFRVAPTMVAAAATLVLTLCAIWTSIQLSYWQNSIRLFSHALRVTERNSLACLNLALAFRTRGNLAENELYLREALRMRPTLVRAKVSLAATLFERGDLEGALEEHQAVLSKAPDDAENHASLANLYENSPVARFRDPQKAAQHARTACELTGYHDRGLLVFYAGTLAIAGEYDQAEAVAKKANGLSVSGTELGETHRLLEQIAMLRTSRTVGKASL